MRKIEFGWRRVSFADSSSFAENALKNIAELEPLLKETYGPRHPMMLRLATLRANNLAKLRKHDEAEAIFAVNVAALDARIGPDKGFAYEARLLRASNLIQLARLDEAAQLYEENDRLTVAQTSLSPSDRAALGLDLAYLRRMQGRFAEAEALARKGLDARLAATPRNEIQIAAAQSSLGRALTGLGRLEEAVSLLEKGLAAHPKEDVGRVRLMFALGEARSEAGRPLDAQKLFKDAALLAIKVEGYDSPNTIMATARSRLEALKLLGASPSTVSSFVFDDMPINPQPLECKLPVRSLTDVELAVETAAAAFFGRERRDCLTMARAFLAPGLGEAAPATLFVRERLAATLNMMGDSDPALEESRTLLADRERINGADHPATARAALLYGQALAALGRVAEAKALTMRASGILPAEAFSTQARRLDMTGAHEAAALDWQAAEAAFDAGPKQQLALAIDILAGRVFNAHYQGRCENGLRKPLTDLAATPGYALLGKVRTPADEALAILQGCAGNWAEADAAYRRLAFGGGDGVMFQDPAFAQLEARRALLLVRNASMSEEAYSAALSAASIARERRYTPDRDAKGKPLGFRRESASSGSDPLAIAFVAQITVSWALNGKTLNSAWFNPIDQAFMAAQDYAQSQAAASLLQSAARAAVTDPDLGQLIDRQVAAAVRIADADGSAARSGTPRDAAAKAAIEADRKALADLTAELRRRFPAYANTARPFGISIADVRKRLKPGEAVLMIQPVGQDVYSFAVSADKSNWNKAKINRRDMDRLVTLVRCRVDEKSCPITLNDTLLFDAKAARALYRELVEPVLPGVGNATTLYTVTSGSLGRIPLGVLIADAPPAPRAADEISSLAKTVWLADRFALATLPSVSSLRAYENATMPSKASRSFAGVGDPALGPAVETSRGGARPLPDSVLGSGNLASISALKALDSLPGTRRELISIARSLGSPEDQLLLAADARETTVKSWPALAQARIVAFATHAMLPGEAKGTAEPGLVLTPPETASQQDDGYLSASEAAQLKLNADMVLLSACNTAGPSDGSGGESLSGLARAFLYAGARSLLVSHWPVSDAVGAAITSETFRILAAKPELSRAEALRMALRGIRTGASSFDGQLITGWEQEWVDPWAWGPFSLIESGS